VGAPSHRTFDVARVERGARVPGGARPVKRDDVAVEEPLEIRVAGDTFAVTMRTPGHDRQLAIGLLFAEGVIASIDDVGAVAHCGRSGDEGRENTIDVIPAPGARLSFPDDAAPRRGTLTTSACGVCGRRTIDDLLARTGPVAEGPSVTAAAILDAMDALRAGQPLFDRTGGCHGAALATFAGEHVASFEDVGRHNAVDKVVGEMWLRRAVPLAGHVLVVSGRASFEIVQKAALAGVPVVASVSAPSSLAVELAQRTRVTLAGFARGDAMNVYACADRIRE